METTVTVHGGRPAVNVKAYAFGGWGLVDAIEARFGCDTETAERATEYAWESAVADFWRYWQDPEATRAYFRDYPEVSIDAGGRSGGWLEVAGLPEPVEDWPAALVRTWAWFEGDVNRSVADYCKLETILEDIDANRWAEPHAQLYNFTDGPDGTTCAVDDYRLREAAPELLDACLEMVKALDNMRLAIAKATASA